MKTKFNRTKCAVKLQKSQTYKGVFNLLFEAYPVFEEGSTTPQRKFTSLNSTISTPIWDKNRPTRGGGFHPKRNIEGVIQCRSDADQKACDFAQKYCQIRQTEYDNQALYPDLYKQQKTADTKANKNFIQYIEELMERRKPTVGEVCHRQWGVMLRLLKEFAGTKTVRFGDITPLWCNQFRDYVQTAPSTHQNKTTLSPNTQRLYFAHFKAALLNAYKEDILPTNISIKIEHIKGEESQRVYLTAEELQTLANTSCGNDETRRAALFSALTGLRYSDIAKLTWAEVSTNAQAPRIEFRQQKTKGVVYMPISPQALTLCGERESPENRVFPNITSAEHVNETIDAWVKRAKIHKKITFHCFRHTFATLQLAGGTDIYTVSKLLGHSDIKTTQVYAKVVDEKKTKATKAIKLKLK